MTVKLIHMFERNLHENELWRFESGLNNTAFDFFYKNGLEKKIESLEFYTKIVTIEAQIGIVGAQVN